MAVIESDLVVGPLVPAAGVTTISLDFFFEFAEWLEVYRSGSDDPLVLNVDYTVAGAGSTNGVVTLTTPANGTDSYSVFLVVPLQRSSDMQLRGEFKSEPFNIEMDRIWQAMQGLRARLGRTLRVGPTAMVPSPPAEVLNSRLWGVDSGGALTQFPFRPFSTDADAVIRYDSVQALLASAEPSRGDGAVWEAQGWRYQEASASATDQHVTTAGGVKLYVQPNPKGEIALEAFGVQVEPADGGSDNAALIEHISNVLSDFRGTLTCGSGFVRTTATLKVPRHASLVCDNTVFDASGDTSGTYSDFALVLKKGGDPVPLPGLASDVAKGSRVLEFLSSHNLSEGSVVIIYNDTDFSFSGFRPIYRAGEYCTVSRVLSATQVELEQHLFDGYAAADVDLFHGNDYATGNLEGFKCIAPGPGAREQVTGISLIYCHKVTLSRVGAENSINAALSIQRSYKITGSKLFAKSYLESGNAYGLIIANSQQVTSQGEFIGTADGVAHGGAGTFAVPVRTSMVHDSSITKFGLNDNGLGTAFDWHGNCEWCSINNCKLYGAGINLSGNNNRASNIEIYGLSNVVAAREVLGFDHVFENILVHSTYDSNLAGLGSRRIMDLGTNSDAFTENTIYGGTLIFRNISITNPIDTRGMLDVRNRGSVQDWNLAVDNVVYNVENLSGTVSTPIVAVRRVSGTDPNRVQVTNITAPQSVSNLQITGADNLGGILIRENGQSGRATVSLSVGVNFVDFSISFPTQFPKPPYVTIAMNDDSDGGLAALTVYPRSVTASGFSCRVRRADFANFETGVDRDVSWQATIMEW